MPGDDIADIADDALKYETYEQYLDSQVRSPLLSCLPATLLHSTPALADLGGFPGWVRPAGAEHITVAR